MKEGTTIPTLTLQSINHQMVSIPDPGAKWVHLQFRRYAGCPICSLHLHSIKMRIDEIKDAGIHEVVVFHSPASELLKYKAGFPFDLIADTEMKLYQQFGVQNSWAAIVSLKVWWAAIWGAAVMPEKTAKADVSRLGLPADFLISPAGKIVYCKYGKNADDQWSVDELLTLTRAI